MALSIERKDDPSVFEFYVQDCLKWAPKGVTRQERASTRRHCEVEVQNRARQILIQAGTVTSGTYKSLETLPFNAEIKLAGLQAGRYILEVTVEDRRSQRTASQNTAFYVQ